MKDKSDHFPHEGFPIYLRHQDGKETKTCWFQCQNHLDKYITRYKLKPKDYTLEYQYQIDVPAQEDKPKRGRKPKKQLFSPLEEFFQ
jgi:hypothetical protein